MAGTPVTYDELTEDHKKNYDAIKSQFEADLIGSFERTRSHGVRWKGFSPEGVLDGSLLNSLERIAVRVVQEIMKHQYSPSGPTLGTHQGEIPLYTRPQLPFTLAASEQQASPAYVVYKSLTGPAFGWYTVATRFSPDGSNSKSSFTCNITPRLPRLALPISRRCGEARRNGVEYIQRFRTVRNRCYSVRLNEKEVVELAALGLAAPLKDLALQADYNSLAHMVQKLTLYEQRHPELYQDKFIKRPITLVETAEVEDPEDQEVAVAEWARGQSLCPANG
ncbi:hypothetical protein QYE76_044672 [Lolium multiflorum]|uniref:Uncharacterized protein n=1 Tax=Lolium multiflorum TaxID=4521 RepID=A0AAD8WXA6_LOLMU|nr:hypothetical protein QYE76_044672 [Lolium multiflorum]